MEVRPPFYAYCSSINIGLANYITLFIKNDSNQTNKKERKTRQIM